MDAGNEVIAMSSDFKQWLFEFALVVLTVIALITSGSHQDAAAGPADASVMSVGAQR